MSQNYTNTIERIYVKVTNRNANVYWLDAVPGTDTLTANIKTECNGYIYPFSCTVSTAVGNSGYHTRGVH